MAKFIRVTNIAQGIDMDTILNVDDIGHISIGPNIIFTRTPFADGTNRIYVRSKEIERLEKILLGEEMMDRNEAVQKLAKVARISVAYAEDLYDSFFPKPVVPQYVADWYEGNNGDLNGALFMMVRLWDEKSRNSDFYRWFRKDKEAFQTLVNMHQFGYEVEEEARYTVRVKGVDGYGRYLNRNLDNQYWFLASDNETGSYRTKHTRKELEEAGFGWVFDCEGVEVKEVE